jgi:clathrin heavy chain
MCLISLSEKLMWDNAALVMIKHSTDAWKHNQFKDIIVQAADVKI